LAPTESEQRVVKVSSTRERAQVDRTDRRDVVPLFGVAESQDDVSIRFVVFAAKLVVESGNRPGAER
jgi:hypothetical protein